MISLSDAELSYILATLVSLLLCCDTEAFVG